MKTVATETAGTDALDTPAFTIQPGTVTRTASSSSRTTLSLTAPAARHLDGGLDYSVHALLFDGRGRFIGRRSGDRSRVVLGTRAAWQHELETDWIAQAARITYEIEYRFDYRRKILGGELPPLAAAAATSDYHRWLDLDPRVLEDRVVRFDLALWVRSSELVITATQHPKLITDSCRTDLELDLLDADHQLMYARTFYAGLNCAHPSFEDTSLSIDRRSLAALRFFELRGRTEVRAVTHWSFDVPA